MEEKLIYKKIADVLADVEAVGKDQRVSSGPAKFNFRGIDQVYNALNPLMSKHKIFSASEILSEREEKITSRSGNGGTRAIVKYRYTFFAEDGSKVSTEVIGEGMDYGDKAYNKAAAVAHKYALTQIFCIPYDDMPDPDKQTHAVKPQNQTRRPQNRGQHNELLPLNHRGFVISFGTYKGKPIGQVDIELLKVEVERIEEEARKREKNIDPRGPVADLIKRVETLAGLR